jgi:hypothetical protein
LVAITGVLFTTQIIYTALAFPAGSVVVTVQVSGTTISGSQTYTYTGLTGIGPFLGGATGGNTVTLTGVGFGTAATTQVLLDETAIPAANITSVTGTQIIYVTPAHAVGSVVVTVTVSGTALEGRGTYTYAAVNPLPGPKPPGGDAGIAERAARIAPGRDD